MFLRHNLHEYCQFFSHIRWSIEQGRFEEFKEIVARSNFVSWHLLKYVIQSITSLMVYLHDVYSRRNRWTCHESTWQCEHVCDVVQKLHLSLPITLEKEGKENETAEARSRVSNEMQAIQWIHGTQAYRQEVWFWQKIDYIHEKMKKVNFIEQQWTLTSPNGCSFWGNCSLFSNFHSVFANWRNYNFPVVFLLS